MNWHPWYFKYRNQCQLAKKNEFKQFYICLSICSLFTKLVFENYKLNAQLKTVLRQKTLHTANKYKLYLVSYHLFSDENLIALILMNLETNIFQSTSRIVIFMKNSSSRRNGIWEDNKFWSRLFVINFLLDSRGKLDVVQSITFFSINCLKF